MPKLHLVGVTEDRSGLILSKSPRAKSGDVYLEVDREVLEAVAEIRKYRSRGGLESPALPARSRDAAVGDDMGLSPREIQHRLRRGVSIASVARAAGVDEWRIERYAAPVQAEQARVVDLVRRLMYAKPRLGESGHPLGLSVQANVLEKGVKITAPEFEEAWSAFESDDDVWVVRFEYVSRGRRQVAEWQYRAADGALSARNRLGSNLAYRDPKSRGRIRALPEGDGTGRRRPAELGPSARVVPKPAPKQAAQPTKVSRKSARRAPPRRRAQPAPDQAVKKTAPKPKAPAKQREAPAKQAGSQPSPPAGRSGSGRSRSMARTMRREPTAAVDRPDRVREPEIPVIGADATGDETRFTRPTIRAPRAAEVPVTPPPSADLFERRTRRRRLRPLRAR